MRRPQLSLTLLLILAAITHAANWPHWRGPFYNGSTDQAALPCEWSRTEGVLWSVELPGCSAATPIVWDDRVFISGVDAAQDRLVAMCFDATDGNLLWRHDLAQGTQRDGRSNYASASPVTDGTSVVFFYANGDLICYDMAGAQRWARNIQQDYGTFAFLWTFAASPTIVGDRFYIQVLQRDVPVSGRGSPHNDSYLLAVDLADGKTLWRQIRPSQAVAESREAFSTPIPHRFGDSLQILVVGGDDLTGHDPATGEELWRWGTWNPRRIGHWRLVPSPVAGGGVVLACAPKDDPIYAIAPKGRGVLGDDAVAWTSASTRQITSDVPTPAFCDGDFFILSDLRKSLARVDATAGGVKWLIETPGRSKYEASPTVADGKVYLINHAGDASVLNAADGKVLATIDMDDPSGGELVRASISIANGRLFIRTTRHLYCIAGR